MENKMHEESPQMNYHREYNEQRERGGKLKRMKNQLPYCFKDSEKNKLIHIIYMMEGSVMTVTGQNGYAQLLLIEYSSILEYF